MTDNGNLTSGSDGAVKRRLLRGFGATSLSPVVTMIIQLGSVPLLLHAWGAAKYGDWLLLSAIPSYLTISDLGFGDASGSDMSMRVAANDREGALETFQSSWVLITIVSILAVLAAAGISWWIPWQHWLKLSSVSNAQAAKIVILLGAYIAMSQQNGVAESGYRSDGHFASGQFWVLMMRLTETIVATIVALKGGSLVAVAATYLVMRTVASIAYGAWLCHLSPWIKFGFGHARLRTIKRMIAPAFGFMALPMGYALNFQGLVLVIGATLGPVAVVSFSTLRTFTRLNTQLIGVVKTALWPELSRAFGAGQIALARRLHRHACQVALALSIGGGAALWLVGPFIYRLWIGHGVAFDATCFHVLLLVIVTNSLWDTSSVIPMSINAHCRIAVTYSIAAAVSLGIAWVLSPRLGSVGAAVALIAMDAWMTFVVLKASLHYVQDDFRDFVVALFEIPRSGRQTLEVAPEL